MVISRHFGSYQQSELSVTHCKGRYSAVKSSQLSWAGPYKKCEQYNFQFTLEYSDFSNFGNFSNFGYFSNIGNFGNIGNFSDIVANQRIIKNTRSYNITFNLNKHIKLIL